MERECLRYDKKSEIHTYGEWEKSQIEGLLHRFHLKGLGSMGWGEVNNIQGLEGNYLSDAQTMKSSFCNMRVPMVGGRGNRQMKRYSLDNIC